jgi:hypothetical protein
LKSVTPVTADFAVSQHRSAEAEVKRRTDHGPMHGEPTAVKELCYSEGVRTTERAYGRETVRGGAADIGVSIWYPPSIIWV